MSTPWVFVHIPSTGGSAINQQIAPSAVHTGRPHTPYYVLNELLGERRAETFMFSFIRSRLGRAVSLAAKLLGQSPLSVQRFTQWLRDGCPAPETNPGYYYSLPMSAPQWCWLNAPGAAFPTVDKLYAFEDREAAIEEINERCDVEIDPTFNPNPSRHHEIGVYDSGETRGLVAKIYAGDFTLARSCSGSARELPSLEVEHHG